MKKSDLFCFLMFFFVACGVDTGDPVIVVETYLQAKVTGDGDLLRSLLCTEMEIYAERELLTFDDIDGVEIVDMSCHFVASADVVRCTGKIVAEYAGEQMEFPISDYRVTQEDGAWKWCGEAP